jgi:DNA-binding response OmpR family regulator
MGRIALIEDNARLAALVRKALSDAGIESDLFLRVDSAWFSLRETPYEAWVVDRGLPDGDGLELVRRLRRVGQLVPCLMLTARDALNDRIEGLEAGADDYLVKPFPMQELVARVRALLRRPSAMASLAPTYADLIVEPQLGTIRCGVDSVTLATAELQIMLSLVQRGGQTVRRTALEATGWGLSDSVNPNALEVALHRLRKKLLAIGSTLQIINVRGHGYALREAPKGE